MKVSRRDLLVGGAGVTAGLVFTPVPWKLLGDVSIWTQNWPWIPQPAHGPVDTKQSACALCAAGCGIRVRMAAGWPVGISGVDANPITKGALCPLGFAAHQLNWHPRRLHQVRHHGRTASWTDAQAAFEKACNEGPVAIVDGRPGRAASTVLQVFAAKHNGSYRVALSPESEALTAYADWSGIPVSGFGYDLENARTIVSFGAPLLDGWGTPGRFAHLWSEKAAGATDPQLRLIQIEPTLSRTAARAWLWMATREGSEEALAAVCARACRGTTCGHEGTDGAVNSHRRRRANGSDHGRHSRTGAHVGGATTDVGDCSRSEPRNRRLEPPARRNRSFGWDCL